MRALILLASLCAAQLAFAQAPQTQAPAPRPAPPPAASTIAPTAPRGALIDINSASASELASLKGIGAVRSEAIVKGRPYKGKDDLVQKKIVPQAVYDEIKDKIIARQK